MTRKKKIWFTTGPEWTHALSLSQNPSVFSTIFYIINYAGIRSYADLYADLYAGFMRGLCGAYADPYAGLMWSLMQGPYAGPYAMLC